MTRGHARFLPFLALVAFACDAGPASVTSDKDLLDFGVVDPAAGSRSLVLRLANEGGGGATVTGVRLQPGDEACGRFTVDPADVFQELAGGESLALTVRFDPDPKNPGGCSCHATAELQVDLDTKPYSLSIPILLRGACSVPVQCAPVALDFGEAVVGRPPTAVVRCFNVEPGMATVREVSVGAPFRVGPIDPALPVDLGAGEQVVVRVGYHPSAPGDHEGALTVRVSGPSGDGTSQVALTGKAVPKFPRCSDGIPPDPPPVLEAKGWSIVLESPEPASYAGVIRSRWYYDEPPPMIGDILLATGNLALPSCEAGQDGHHAWWKNCNPGPDDLFINAHAIPYDAGVETLLRRVDVWDHLTIRGYEVLKVDYPNDSWWTDEGCHTLIVTWVCAT